MRDTIFVRVPKTASRTVQDALMHAFLRDGRARLYASSRHPDCRGLMPEFDWPRFYKFAFVRNPWERMVSAYFFKHTEKFREALRIFRQEGRIDDAMVDLYEAFWQRRPTFDEWVLDGCERYLMVAKNQVDYLVDEAGDVAVDFVGRYERLEEDFARVCDDIGCARIALSARANATEHAPYTEYYTSASIARVAEICERDVTAFGYRYGA